MFASRCSLPIRQRRAETDGFANREPGCEHWPQQLFKTCSMERRLGSSAPRGAQLLCSLHSVTAVVDFHTSLLNEKQLDASSPGGGICILCLIKAWQFMPKDVQTWNGMLFAKYWDFIETWKLISREFYS